MNRNDIVDLLSAAAGYDHRTIGEIDVAAWAESARRKTWNRATALDAIHEFYSETPNGWITPGHITQHHRNTPTPPSDRTVDQALGLPAAPPASPERRAELMAKIRALATRKGIQPRN